MAIFLCTYNLWEKLHNNYSYIYMHVHVRTYVDKQTVIQITKWTQLINKLQVS